MCGSLFSPKVPKTTAAPAIIAPPPPTTIARTMENPEVESARMNERRRVAAMQGYQSTQRSSMDTFGSSRDQESGGSVFATGKKKLLGE